MRDAARCQIKRLRRDIVHWPSNSKANSHVVTEIILHHCVTLQCRFKSVVEVEQTRSYCALATINSVSELVGSI